MAWLSSSSQQVLATASIQLCQKTLLDGCCSSWMCFGETVVGGVPDDNVVVICGAG